jgi:hypothetical protein
VKANAAVALLLRFHVTREFEILEGLVVADVENMASLAVGYEGFFLEAQDERGVPFLSVYNFWRGQHKGGGQGARSEALFPFSHG